MTEEEERTLFTEMVTIEYGEKYPVSMRVEAMLDEMETILPKNYTLQDISGMVVSSEADN